MPDFSIHVFVSCHVQFQLLKDKGNTEYSFLAHRLLRALLIETDDASHDLMALE
jgi:hypothetical protein